MDTFLILNPLWSDYNLCYLYPWLSFIIATYTLICNRQSPGSSSSSRGGYAAQSPFHSPHPLISYHFTFLSASTSLFLLVSHNNPSTKQNKKASPGRRFSNSQGQKNTMAAQRVVRGSRRRSVSVMNALTSMEDFLSR